LAPGAGFGVSVGGYGGGVAVTGGWQSFGPR